METAQEGRKKPIMIGSDGAGPSSPPLRPGTTAVSTLDIHPSTSAAMESTQRAAEASATQTVVPASSSVGSVGALPPVEPLPPRFRFEEEEIAAQVDKLDALMAEQKTSGVRNPLRLARDVLARVPLNFPERAALVNAIHDASVPVWQHLDLNLGSRAAYGDPEMLEDDVRVMVGEMISALQKHVGPPGADRPWTTEIASILAGK